MIQNVSILSIIFFSLSMVSSASAGFLIKEGYHDVIYTHPKATVEIMISGREEKLPIGTTIHYELTTKNLHTLETTTVTIPSVTLSDFAENLQKEGSEILHVKKI